MNIGEATTPRRHGPGEGKREGLSSPAFDPLFLGDWVTAVFIHYAVDAGVLQQEVPFELDLFEGRAFVSLVAFSMREPTSGTGTKPVSISSPSFSQMPCACRWGRRRSGCRIGSGVSHSGTPTKAARLKEPSEA